MKTDSDVRKQSLLHELAPQAIGKQLAAGGNVLAATTCSQITFTSQPSAGVMDRRKEKVPSLQNRLPWFSSMSFMGWMREMGLFCVCF